MVRKPIQLPRPANPNIDDVLAAFLREQEARLKPRTFGRYRDAVDLLRGFLDDYGWNYLTAATKLLHEGWTISCSLGRDRGIWRLLEVANVYP